ncbi:MAG TPA: hypothetical protein VLE24_03790, partial [Methyloceanibacter sp.]|nr:hypothetical protein [Methyloceanibacter sp.]
VGFQCWKSSRHRKAGIRHRPQGRACGRREGNPAQILAAADCARSILGWQLQFDDLSTIVAHESAWERNSPVKAAG